MRRIGGGAVAVVWLVALGCGGRAGGPGERQPPPGGERESPPVALPAPGCAEDAAGCPPAHPEQAPPEGPPVTVPAPRCQPTAGGPHWLEEGETLQLRVTCATGLEVPGSDLHVGPLPPGAHYDARTATVHWTPGLDQAAVYTLTLTGPDGETGTVKVGVADRWSDPANVKVVDPTRYTEEYGLPVFHLQASAPLHNLAHVPVTVVYRGHRHAATARLRGNSSLGFPKNSYTVKFPREDPFHEPSATDGFTHRRSVVLVTTFNDNSYVRTRLAFELWRRLSPQGIHVRAYSAVLYLNGAYHGLYTVTDHVDEHLMARHGLSKEGNLYKAETADANFLLEDMDGERKEELSMGLEKKEGTPEEGAPGAFADMEELVRFVATASPAAFRTEAPRRISLRDYEDWWILVNLLVARDSDCKNAYHYHDPLGGPWRYVPWDMDGTFGQGWMTERYLPKAKLNPGTENGMFGRLLAEPTFAGPLRARFRALLHGELAPATLHALLDAYAREVAPSARRDEQKWGKAYRSYRVWRARDDFTTFDEEVAYIREWISERWAFLDEALQQEP